MLEINPLASLTDGRVLVCDSKVNFDDNASYRQKEIHEQRDESQENPIEVEAKKYDLNYIKLERENISSDLLTLHMRWMTIG